MVVDQSLSGETITEVGSSSAVYGEEVEEGSAGDGCSGVRLWPDLRLPPVKGSVAMRAHARMRRRRLVDDRGFSGRAGAEKG